MLGITKSFNKAYTDVPKGITHGLTKGGGRLTVAKVVGGSPNKYN